MTLPSLISKRNDRARGYTQVVDIVVCRFCDETYDFFPRVKGVPECVVCGAGAHYLERRRIED